MKKLLSILVAGVFCTSMYAQKLNESFEDEQFPPEGWTVVADHAYPSFSSWNRITRGENTPTFSGNTGYSAAYVNPLQGASNYLITPQLQPESGEILIFYARLDEYAKGGELQIMVSTNGTNPEDFTETIGALPTTQSAEGPRLFKEWKGYQIPMTDYVGKKIFIAFHQYDQSSASKIFLDDVSGVSLAGNSTCDKPVKLHMTAISDNSVTFVWEGEADSYQVLIVERGTAADWTKSRLIMDHQVTYTGLEEDTEYMFYIRTYCSADDQSLAPTATFKTTCRAETVPWTENFLGHPTSSTNPVVPECWIIASESPMVFVVTSKSYDDEGESTIIKGSEHLLAQGGSSRDAQVFAMPAMDAVLSNLEVAFDYMHNVVSDNYGKLEVGYMTNPSDPTTFVAIKQLPQELSYTHAVVTLETVPAEAGFVAFRYAGGTSNLGNVQMDNFVLAEIGKSKDFNPAGVEDVTSDPVKARKMIENGLIIIEHNGQRYNMLGASMQ